MDPIEHQNIVRCGVCKEIGHNRCRCPQWHWFISTFHVDYLYVILVLFLNYFDYVIISCKYLKKYIKWSCYKYWLFNIFTILVVHLSLHFASQTWLVQTLTCIRDRLTYRALSLDSTPQWQYIFWRGHGTPTWQTQKLHRDMCLTAISEDCRVSLCDWFLWNF